MLTLTWNFSANDLKCPAEQAKAVTGFINAVTESQKVSDVTVNVWQAIGQVCVKSFLKYGLQNLPFCVRS